MGMGDWISFDPAPMSTLDRMDEVDQFARDEVGRTVQTRLRARVDPGVRLEDALRAQAVRVSSEGDRLVIDEDDQGRIMAAAAAQTRERDDENDAKSAVQLFEMGSGVPQVIDGKLSYRQISLRDLFGEQKQEEQDRVVESITNDTIRDGIVDAYERGINEIERKYPAR